MRFHATTAGILAAFIVASLMLAGCNRQAAERAKTSSAPTAQQPAESAQLDRATFEKVTMDWRTHRLERLRKPDGWLSLVGLHWVDPGTHALGMADSNDIHLRTGPAKLGKLVLAADGKAAFTADSAAGVTIDGKPATGEIVLRSDATTDQRGPTIVAFNGGSANFQLIERSGKFALRVKDANAPTRTGFTGIDYFDADPSWRVAARFEPHPKGQTIPIASVINTVDPMMNPGTVVFEKDGKTYRLEAVDEGDGRLFLIYADHTNGKTTYAAGRFLYANPPKNGMTVVDFNQSYNPPCVFTHYATCPLPPPGNRLDLTINAGEKSYRGAVQHEEQATIPTTGKSS
jgi:uncharacterized protein (DUF1684 family)